MEKGLFMIESVIATFARPKISEKAAFSLILNESSLPFMISILSVISVFLRLYLTLSKFKVLV